MYYDFGQFDVLSTEGTIGFGRNHGWKGVLGEEPYAESHRNSES